MKIKGEQRREEETSRMESEEFGKYCSEKAIIKVNKIIFKNAKTGNWPKALNNLRTVNLRKFTES